MRRCSIEVQGLVDISPRPRWVEGPRAGIEGVLMAHHGLVSLDPDTLEQVPVRSYLLM